MKFFNLTVCKRLYENSEPMKILLKQRRKLSGSSENSSSVEPVNNGIFSKKEFEEFISLQPKVIKDITSVEPFNRLPFLTDRIKSMLDYNLSGGTNSSGLGTIFIYKMISKQQEGTNENIKQAVLLGWCVRFYESSLLMLDDVLDNALMRYGKPTWNSLPHIGSTAMLHIMFTESCMFFLLQKYFSQHPQYNHILRSFLNAVFYLNYSQFLDTIPFNENNLTDEFLQVSHFGKAAETSFSFGAAIAMYLAGIEDPQIHQKVRNVFVKFGRWFQMQNDYLDSFGEPQSRPIGTDIKRSRISWLSTNAYQKCNSDQRKLFQKYYGSDSKESVSIITNLYKELGMTKLYEESESKLHSEILEEIKIVPNDIVPHEIFHRLLTLLQLKLL